MSTRQKRAATALTGLIDSQQTTLENLKRTLDTSRIALVPSPLDHTGISFAMVADYLAGSIDQLSLLRQLTKDPDYLTALADHMEQEQ